MISGSYWPGDIYLFRGLGGTEFAKAEILKAKDGSSLNAGPKWESERKPNMDSLASAPRLQDVDADGDLDLLVGNIAGNVILIENEGDAKNPVFGDKKSRVQAGGKDLNVARNDSGPTTADWDGDGLWDLIVGGGDGSVWYFENIGTAKVMAFAAGVQLIAKSGKHSATYDDLPTRPSARAKPHVCDWDGDGHLDLLVGDYVSVKMPAPELTPEQVQQRDELHKKRDKISREIAKLYGNGEAEQTPEQKKQFAEAQERYMEVYEQLRPLEAEDRPTGYVWVYLREPGDAQAVDAAAPEGGAPKPRKAL